MSLNDLVSINTHYTRSINLERDSESVDVINAYIPTSRALRTFLRISDSFNTEQLPRAWSLIGPYGSGKSSFSVFLSQLLSNPRQEGSKASLKILGKTEEILAQKFKNETKDSTGFFRVLITGAPESLTKRLLLGLSEAAALYWKDLPGKNPQIVGSLKKAVNTVTSSSEVITLFETLQKELEKTSCKGILLVIDELGKFLEYEARHYGANDIYLLQSLAEHACKGGNVNLYLFVMLHQSFEQYAKGLGENLKNEWSKVQGRFEDVPFLESGEQILRVVSAAFKQKLTKAQQKLLDNKTRSIVNVLIEQDAIPSALTNEDTIELYSKCYPLHPVSALVLPLLCQKVAQNERTLFSYLGSHEEFGLQQMMETLDGIDSYVYPHHIYDYFITNQPAVLGDYLTHRRWTEVVTAIERLGDAPQDEINILKTIGVLNIIGSKGGFKASKSILETCLDKKTTAKSAIKSLTEKSIVTYQRFNSEYRVWQGSDFDLEDALQDEINNIGQFSLAESLNNAKNMLPIVARRYTIEVGTLRYFVPTFIDAKCYKKTDKQSSDARIIFYLASDQDDEKIFTERVINYFSDLDIVALCLNGAQLREAVAETMALKRVAINRQELNNDPVAKREFKDRLTAAILAEDKLLKNLVESPEENVWFYKGRKHTLNSKREMQEKLSRVLDDVYSKTPRIFNELINRDKPSGQANAARKQLLYAMKRNESLEDLGIDKFPAEKAIYRAFLRKTGLHKETDEGSGIWQLSAPNTLVDDRTDGSRIRHVWDRIEKFMDSTEKGSKSFIDLNKELLAPPYGVKAGLLPIFYITAYLVSQHELAIYENRRYKPYLTDEMLDRFLKRPDEFEIQRFKIVGLRASIFKQYSKVLKSKSNKTPTLLELAKPLVSLMNGLPEYTQKTKTGLSKKAMDVRSAFDLAKTPEILLFENLPKALGFDGLDDKSKEEELENFSSVLTEILRELNGAYGSLLERQKELLAQAFNFDPKRSLADIRKLIAGNFDGLENYTVDAQGLRAFIMRLIKSSGSDSEWLESILMFLGNKSCKTWRDSDQAKAEFNLTKYAHGMLDLEKLRIHERDTKKNFGNDELEVYLLSNLKKGSEKRGQVVAVDEASSLHTESTRRKILNLLKKELDDKELRLGALAEIVDEFLIDYSQESSNISDMPIDNINSKKEVS